MNVEVRHTMIQGGVGMAYKIQYTPQNNRRYPLTIKNIQIEWGRWLTVLLIITAALWLRLKGVPDFLIPGDPVVTKSAAEMLFEEIRAGESVNDAVAVFCKEILDGAQF